MTILGSDHKNILYQDMSEWMEGDHYLYPEAYTITVTAPGKSSGVAVPVMVKSSTRITKEDLGFAVCDGIYTFSVYNCGTQYTLQRGIYPELECCINKALIQYEGQEEVLEIDKKFAQMLAKIEIGDTQDVDFTLEYIKRTLDNLKCDCICK